MILGTAATNPRRKQTVTPYVGVRGAARFLDFVRDAFGGDELGRVPNPDGTIGHAEIRVGDSVLMTFDSSERWPETPSFLSVYMDDVDAAVERALEAGATIVTEVTTSGIVGERGGRVKDPVGNVWWLQTHLEEVPVETMQQRFGDPEELAILRSRQQSLDNEMRARSKARG